MLENLEQKQVRRRSGLLNTQVSSAKRANAEAGATLGPGAENLLRTAGRSRAGELLANRIITSDGKPRNVRRSLPSVRARFAGSEPLPRSSGCENGSLSAGSSGLAHRLAGGSCCASPSGPA